MRDALKIYGGLKANLPTLMEREPGFCTDTGELYIGTSTGNKLVTVIDFEEQFVKYVEMIANTPVIWKNPVSTYTAIATTYPTPEIHWTVQTLDDNHIFNYHDGIWNYVGQMSSTILNELVDDVTNEIARKNAESSRVVAESGRVANENARATAEGTRITNETARTSAESARVTAENGRVSAESARVSNMNTVITNEGIRVSAENARLSAETARASAESARVSTENSRTTAEASRVTAETNRANNETARVSNESTRNNSENSRLDAETTRLGNEALRISQENSRVYNESGRVSAETNRSSAESNRALAETARMSAENTRASAESARASAFTTSEATRQTTFNTSEATRQTEFDTIKTAYQSATTQNTSVEVTSARADALTGVTHTDLNARLNDASPATTLIREAIPSGLTQFSTIDYATMKTTPNTIKLTGGAVAFVNGMKITIPTSTTISLSAPPASGEREDLVFLEVYRAEVTNAVMSRIRVVDGVDFSTNVLDGFTKNVNDLSYATLNAQTITPQGGNASPLAVTGNDYATFLNYQQRNLGINSYGYAYLSPTDAGIYIAGKGNATSKSTLKTYDGYVYAIPLFRVRRRNSGAYSVANPNGAKTRTQLTLSYFATPTSNDIGKIITATSEITAGNTPIVGDIIMLSTLTTPFYEVTAVNGNTLTVKILNYGYGASPNYYVKSNRPDLLFCDIIDDRDILDLRHQVSLTGFNHQSLLEENFDKLLRGELQTTARKKMLKTYHGIAKTPTDANTVYYNSFDGSSTPEVNIINPTSSVLSSTYKPSPTGTGLYFKTTANNAIRFNMLQSSFTLQADFTPDSIEQISGNYGYMFMVTNDPTSKFIAVCYNKSASNLILRIDGVATGATVPIANGQLYRVRLVFTTSKIYVYVNGKLINEISGTYNYADYTQIILAYGSSGWGFNGTISDFSISNIDRGATDSTFPADVTAGYARITSAMNGQRKTHSDALTSQYTCGIAKGVGSGHSAGVSSTQATAGTWASGDTIKAKGLAGSIISGVIDTDTALARLVADTSTSYVLPVDTVTGFAVNDTFSLIGRTGTIVGNYTITAIDTQNNTITTAVALTLSAGALLVETTASTSSPVVKYMNGSTLTSVTGTWSGLGTTEATFTLGTNASLTTADIQIEYSLNMVAGQGGIPEVYTATLAGEAKGKKLIVGTVAIRDDYVGKVSGSTTENPNIFKHNNNQSNSSLLIPSSFPTELQTVSNIQTLNGTTTNIVASTNGSIPQSLFSFNLIRMIEDKYGTIPSVDKVGYAKNNIGKISYYYYGYGSCPTGNKVYFTFFVPAGSGASPNNQWFATPFTHTSGSVSVLASAFTSTVPTNYASYVANGIDANGFIHFLAYTDASDGVTASTIFTDYVYIDVELKTPTGYDVLVPENPRRDDGVANVLLVRKETKEVQTYFNASNTDGVVTYGDYVPYQGVVSKVIPLGTIDLKRLTKPLILGTNIGTASSSIYSMARKRYMWDLLPKATNVYLYNYYGTDMEYLTQEQISVVETNDTSSVDASTNVYNYFHNKGIVRVYSASGTPHCPANTGYVYFPTNVNIKNERYYVIELVSYNNVVYVLITSVRTQNSVGGAYNEVTSKTDVFPLANCPLIK